MKVQHNLLLQEAWMVCPYPFTLPHLAQESLFSLRMYVSSVNPEEIKLQGRGTLLVPLTVAHSENLHAQLLLQSTWPWCTWPLGKVDLTFTPSPSPGEVYILNVFNLLHPHCHHPEDSHCHLSSDCLRLLVGVCQLPSLFPASPPTSGAIPHRAARLFSRSSIYPGFNLK